MFLFERRYGNYLMSPSFMYISLCRESFIFVCFCLRGDGVGEAYLRGGEAERLRHPPMVQAEPVNFMSGLCVLFF